MNPITILTESIKDGAPERTVELYGFFVRNSDAALDTELEKTFVRKSLNLKTVIELQCLACRGRHEMPLDILEWHLSGGDKQLKCPECGYSNAHSAPLSHSVDLYILSSESICRTARLNNYHRFLVGSIQFASWQYQYGASSLRVSFPYLVDAERFINSNSLFYGTIDFGDY